MRARLIVVFGTVIGLSGLANEALAASYILQFHGRSQGSWEDNSASASGWITKSFGPGQSYHHDGNDGLWDANSTVKNAIKAYCDGGNTCVIHCYSAGCLRVSLAIDDIRQTSTDLDGLLWIDGSGSAAGGSELAEKSTSGGTKWLAKLLGQQEEIDFQMVPSYARDTLSYIHDELNVIFWHASGNKDVCKGFWIFKICGGTFLPGYDDGVVAFHSTAGYSDNVAKYSICSVSASDESDTSKHVSGKYPYHHSDMYWSNHQCGGGSWDHFSVPNFVTAALSKSLDPNASNTFSYYYWSDATGGDSHCSGADCDQPFYDDPDADWSEHPDGTPTGADDVSDQASDTTGDTSSASSCMGRCGLYDSGRSCQCDSYCTTGGDCCADYSGAANCSAVLN